MQLKIPHQFTKEAAVARVKQALDEARHKLGEQATIDEERWEGDTLHFAFTAQKQHISGTLAVGDTHFDVYVKLPLMLRMFEGKIQKVVEAQVAGMR